MNSVRAHAYTNQSITSNNELHVFRVNKLTCTPTINTHFVRLLMPVVVVPTPTSEDDAHNTHTNLTLVCFARDWRAEVFK